MIFESGMGLRHFREISFSHEQSLVERFIDRKIWIQGQIVSHPIPSDLGNSYILKTSVIKLGDENYDQKFLIQIFSKADRVPKKGDLIKIKTKLYVYSNPKNIQKLKNIQAYGTVFEDGQFQLIHAANLFSTKIREQIFCVAKKYLTPTNFSYYRVMVFGDQALLSHETMVRLKETGLLHLFVISATHLAFVWFIGFRILRWLLCWIPRFHRTKYFFLGVELGAVAVVFVFLQLINPPISTFRAVCSMVLFFLLKATHRAQHPLWNLGIVFFMILIVNPLYLFDVSTQLTFGSVAGILIASHGFQQKKESNAGLKQKIKSQTKNAVIATGGATLFTAPILYLQFNQIYWASFFYNLLIVPTIGELLSFVAVASLVWAMIPVDIFHRVGFQLLNQLFIWFEKILYFDVRKELYTVGSLFTRVSEMYLILAGFLFGIVLWLHLARNRKQMIQR